VMAEGLCLQNHASVKERRRRERGGGTSECRGLVTTSLEPLCFEPVCVVAYLPGKAPGQPSLKSSVGSMNLSCRSSPNLMLMLVGRWRLG
jgi:hypothetical protein